MAIIRRTGLFLLINFLVITMLSIILGPLGLKMDDVSFIVGFCALIGFGGSFFSLWISKAIAKSRYKVKLIDPNTASPRELFIYNVVHRMAEENGIRMPEVGVFKAPSPNAFATGPTKNKALIAFSNSILSSLSEDELAAVAGHEMSHILQGDMVTMSLIMGVVNTFVLALARILAMVLDSALRDNKGRGGLGYFGYRAVVYLLQNVLFLLANIPIAAYSRFREYRADAGAAKMVSPQAMIAALRAIDVSAPAATQRVAEADMAMIHNKRKVSIYSTHPSIEDRVRALERMLIR